MSQPIPQHVSIIMDGNGRWAQARGLSRTRGHEEGIVSVREAVAFAAEKGVRYLSLFAFSEENWNRPALEVETLFGLMLAAVDKEIPILVEHNVRLHFIGDFSRMTPAVREAMLKSAKKTEGSTGLQVIVALGYSGRWDILQAAKAYARDCLAQGKVLELKAPDFAGYLSTASFPDPDLLIRTSGELRMSNFLLWQHAYTEFYFTPVFWPDFRKTQFEAALRAYSGRNRRFGKTQEQL